MQPIQRNRAASILALLVVLCGCASQPLPALPTPTSPPRDAVLTLPALLQSPQRWSGQPIVLIAAVAPGTPAQVLTVGATDPQPSPSAAPRQAIWLTEPLPETITAQLADGAVVIRLRGLLSPPGAYGRDQQFTYQFSAQKIDLLKPEPTTIANLVLNPGALDRILLRLEGTLLVQRESALLVDQVSAGGVPTANGQQIKLARAAIDSAALEPLQRSGEVRWGAVQIVGWWQDGALTPLTFELIAPASPTSN